MGKTFRGWEEPETKCYHVKYNVCNCHPETCGCNDYAVHKPDGSKHSTFFKEDVAHEVADALNKAL